MCESAGAIYQEIRRIHPAPGINSNFSRELLKQLGETTLRFYRIMKETFPEDTRIDFLIERLETTLRDLEVSINLDTVTNTILFAIHRDISKRTFSFGLVRQYLPEGTT